MMYAFVFLYKIFVFQQEHPNDFQELFQSENSTFKETFLRKNTYDKLLE